MENKITCIIPARYNSTRFPGKPLADILGKPMVWWVYQQAKRAKNLDELVVATDDERIVKVCDSFEIPSVMTKEHINGIHRMHEAATKLNSKAYILLNGDEPIMESEAIDEMANEAMQKDIYHCIAYKKFDDPVEVVDSGNIKIAVSDGKILYLSRSPIPYPHKSLDFSYYKIIGLQIFSKEALDFFVNAPERELERIEDIVDFRWLENGKSIACKEVNSKSISVDNYKDIPKVTQIIKDKFKRGELLDIKERL